MLMYDGIELINIGRAKKGQGSKFGAVEIPSNHVGEPYPPDA